MHIPRSALGLYDPGPPPIARDACPDRSCPGKVRSRCCAVASNAESPQGGRHHEAASDHRRLYPDLLAYLSMPEEVRGGFDRWRERYSLRQVHRNIYTQQQYVHKSINNSTITKPMNILRSPLGLYNPGPAPIARDVGPDRFCPGKVRSRRCTVASNAESPQGGEAPRGCKWPPKALT